MLIKQVVNETVEGAKTYKSYCRANESEDFKESELNIAEIEYDDAFGASLSGEVSKYYIHTVYTHDYESSSDSGDGRDDYYTEENDEQINPSQYIIKDDKFIGVVCESFGREAFLLVDCPETVIYHPQNYGGRNYHYYREKQFKLIKK